MHQLEYKIYQFNSANDDICELEALLTLIHNDETHTFISMNDSILQSGTYVAILHYEITKPAPEGGEARMVTGAEL